MESNAQEERNGLTTLPIPLPSWNLRSALRTFVETNRLCSSQSGKHRSRPGTALI